MLKYSKITVWSVRANLHYTLQCETTCTNNVHSFAKVRHTRNLLDTRIIIEILAHPFYSINVDWFPWEWSKRKIPLIFFQNGRRKKLVDKGCLFLFNYFIDRSLTLMSPFFCQKNMFFKEKPRFFDKKWTYWEGLLSIK